MSVKQEYSAYQTSTAIELIAQHAHQKHYCGQTSSVNFSEISHILDKYAISSYSHVLDLGCGKGTFSLQMAARYHCLVHGIDIAGSLINEANSSTRKYALKHKPNFIVGDFNEIPLKGKKFHCMTVIGSLYWSENLDDLLSHWHQFLEKEGIILLSLNLELKGLNEAEKSQIDNTNFIRVSDFYQSIKKNKFAIIEEINQNHAYLVWLNRWCDAMQLYKQQLLEELGEARGHKLIQRFEAYKDLSSNNKVNKFNLILSAGK